MKLLIGSDHAAFQAKERLKEYLLSLGHQVIDKGTYNEESCHYPRFAQAVAKGVLAGEGERGVLICGTGIGMSLAANRYKGIRATLCHDPFTAQASREHNDSNILCMGARVLSWEQMREITDLWLNTPFGGGRHALRLAMLDEED